MKFSAVSEAFRDGKLEQAGFWSGPGNSCIPVVIAKICFIVAYSSQHLWRETAPMHCVFVTKPHVIPWVKDSVIVMRGAPSVGSHPDLFQQPNTPSSDMGHLGNLKKNKINPIPVRKEEFLGVAHMEPEQADAGGTLPLQRAERVTSPSQIPLQRR